MASTRLTRTPSSGDNQKYTVSCWVKRTGLGASTTVYSTGDTTANNNGRMLFIDADDKIEISYYNSGYTYEVTTNRVLRDTHSFYHIVVAFDSTQVTASDRIKIWVNGEQESSFATSSYPSLNASFNFGSATHYIGDLGGRSIYSDFVLSHLHYIDGTTYAASDFGQTDTASGIWTPKPSPSVTYGTNGVFLNFANSSDLGNDVSGNNNDFTMSGTGTQTLDTPSNVFATLNALNSTLTNSTLTNGNLQFAGGRQDANYAFTSGTIAPSQGKWYWEVKAVDNAEIDQVGVAKMDLAQFANISNSGGLQATTYGGKGVQFSNGVKVGDGSGSTYMGGFSANDVLMVALDLDNGNIYFGRNGQWSDGAGNADQTFANAVAAFTNLTVGDAYVPAHCMRNFGGSNPGESEYNFGNGIFGTTAVSTPESDSAGLGKFEYSVPTGYYALCTKNIADYG